MEKLSILFSSMGFLKTWSESVSPLSSSLPPSLRWSNLLSVLFTKHFLFSFRTYGFSCEHVICVGQGNVSRSALCPPWKCSEPEYNAPHFAWETCSPRCCWSGADEEQGPQLPGLPPPTHPDDVKNEGEINSEILLFLFSTTALCSLSKKKKGNYILMPA